MFEVLKYVTRGVQNEVKLFFFELDDNGDEQAFDDGFISRTEITIHGANAGADVSINSDSDIFLSWNGTGRLTFIPGNYTLDPGDYDVSIHVFDVGHPNGQTLIARYGPFRLRMRVL